MHGTMTNASGPLISSRLKLRDVGQSESLGQKIEIALSIVGVIEVSSLTGMALCEEYSSKGVTALHLC